MVWSMIDVILMPLLLDDSILPEYTVSRGIFSVAHKLIFTATELRMVGLVYSEERSRCAFIVDDWIEGVNGEKVDDFINGVNDENWL